MAPFYILLLLKILRHFPIIYEIYYSTNQWGFSRLYSEGGFLFHSFHQINDFYLHLIKYVGGISYDRLQNYVK